MNKKWIRIVATTIAGIILCITMIWGMDFKAKADFGDLSDYGSSWDSGGSWDWDSGSSWDSGSWDSYDYGGGSGGDMPFGVVVIIVVVIVIYALASNKKNGNGYNNSGSNAYRPMQPPVRQPQAPPKPIPNRTDEISRIIQKTDPAFTAPDFQTFGKQVFMDIQNAWMKRDLEPVKAVLHQNLYQQTQKQVERKIADGIVNHLEMIGINTTYLTSYRQDAEYEYLAMYLAASMIDYQEKEATGQILFGDKTTRWNLFYKMTFMRTKGSKTRSAQEKDKGIMCPNCGAPLKGTSFGKCAYCDSVILTGVYDWVLSDFGTIRQDTIDEGVQVYREPATTNRTNTTGR